MDVTSPSREYTQLRSVPAVLLQALDNQNWSNITQKMGAFFNIGYMF